MFDGVFKFGAGLDQRRPGQEGEKARQDEELAPFLDALDVDRDGGAFTPVLFGRIYEIVPSTATLLASRRMSIPPLKARPAARFGQA